MPDTLIPTEALTSSPAPKRCGKKQTARSMPLLLDVAMTIAKAASPHVEKGGHISSRADLVNALEPIIGHYRVADAVCGIGFFRTAFSLFDDEDDEADALFAVTTILEDFASGAYASGPSCVSARAHLIEMAASDDAWELGLSNMQSATRRACSDVKELRSGKFKGHTFGDPSARILWLYGPIEEAEGSDAAREMALASNAERAATAA